MSCLYVRFVNQVCMSGLNAGFVCRFEYQV